MKGVIAAAQGRVGKDPERKTSKAGKPYAHFSVATDKPARAGEKAETQWVNVMVFNEDEIDHAMDVVKKGIEVYVEGPLSATIWKDQVQLTIMAWAVQPIASFRKPADPGYNDDEIPDF